MVLSPVEDPVAGDSVDSRLREVRKRPVESDKLGARPNSLHGVPNSIAVTTQVVVPICDDDVVSNEGVRYVLVENVGGLLCTDIVALPMRPAEYMCEGNCNSRLACSVG